MDGELELGEAGKMWCYCCAEEIQKHITENGVTIEWGGLLEHMSRSVGQIISREGVTSYLPNVNSTVLLYTNFGWCVGGVHC